VHKNVDRSGGRMFSDINISSGLVVSKFDFKDKKVQLVFEQFLKRTEC
jgi:hypothetical protein